ncbi:acetyl-CoA carboxylase biotin carboxyl carrier protein subunit [Salinibacillus aidingensis]|uniref:Acetyl-CoA carboxylase biotin carboxyl carrier protein subunit n=1 Tax=Salinibacillus aidingensis TaxID=237684 RepID=A0ABN1BFQ4_9BACI
MKEVKSTMAGNVWKIVVEAGQEITNGEDVVILESMKMEIPVSAESDGVVKEVKVKEGDFVNEGDRLVILE